MSKHYPIKFTLEDGVHVEVNKTADNTYDFTLDGKKGSKHFTYVDNGDKLKDEELLDFDQLNAVRRFWLEQHDVI
jgi:uncharacterized protein YgiM (DUF1202 family)